MSHRGGSIALRSFFLFSIGLVGAAGGCCDGVEVCTQADCVDGLEVELSTVPMVETTVEVTDVDGTLRTAICEPNLGCVVSFEGFHPRNAAIRVVNANGSLRVTAKPKYATFRPNGECCTPTCRWTVVVVDVP